MQEKRFKYIGIADCYGLESLLYYERRKSFVLYLRALANRHRHAVYYEVWLSEEEAKPIKEFCKKQKWTEALKELKKHSIIFSEKDRKEFEESWRLIPNPKLDGMFQQRLLREALCEGVVTLRCSKGHTVKCEPDGEYAVCQKCGEKVKNPIYSYV